MTLEILTALIVFAFVSSITPGPNNLMLMASGANFGARRTVPHILGIILGFQFMIYMVGAGLTRLFDAFPVSYAILKILSAIFLTYLAWKIATAGAPGQISKQKASAAAGKPLTFLQAAAFQWVNPKAWALSLAAVSAYSAPSAPLMSLVAVSLAYIVAGIPCILTWTFMGTQIRRILNNTIRLRLFNWACAAALMLTLWPILATMK